MSLKNRVRRLEEKANMMAIGRGRSVSSRLCTGISSEELLQMIEERLLPESVPVLENIVQQMEEYHQRPPRKLPNGEMIPRIHGFMDWLWGLEAGSSSLPEKIPPELLLAWRNGYVNHPAGSTPIPVRRCEDCLLVLPNASPDGFVVIREETDPPAPQDPDRCSNCGRQRREGLVSEIIWARPTSLEDPPRPYLEP